MSRTKKFAFGLITLVVAVVLLEITSHAVMLAVTGQAAWKFRPASNLSVLDFTNPYLPFLRGGAHKQLSGPDLAVNRGSDELRVLALGGSTTINQRSFESSWAGQIQERLQAEYKARKVSVVIQAHGAWMTSDNLIFFALKNQDYNFDLVIIYDGWNDMVASCIREFVSDYSHARNRPDAYIGNHPLARLKLAVDALRRELSLAKYSATLSFVQYTVGRSDTQLFNRWIWKQPDIPSLGCYGIDTYRRNLRSQAVLAQASGAQVLFVSHLDQVTLPGDRDTWIHYAILREHNRMMREVAAQTNSLFYDFAAQFEVKPEYFTDRIHVSAEGDTLQGRMISDYLIANRVLDRLNRFPQRRHVVLPFSELRSARRSSDGALAPLPLDGVKDGEAGYPAAYVTVPQRETSTGFRIPVGYLPKGRYALEFGAGFAAESFVATAAHGSTEYAVRLIDRSGAKRDIATRIVAIGPDYRAGQIAMATGEFEIASPAEFEMEFAVTLRGGESQSRHFWRYPILRLLDGAD